MKTRHLLTLAILLIATSTALAQGLQNPPATMMDGLASSGLQTLLKVEVNPMDNQKRAQLNRLAADYRSQRRGIRPGQVARSMLTGGVGAVINILGTELIQLAQLRATQKHRWQEMRQKECRFVDSLQSINGQSDFYSLPSSTGPLDPTNMNFDGITLQAHRNGREMLRIVCHIDTTRLDHMFLHSKFHLVVDTILFRPYDSFLPNLPAYPIGRKGDAKPMSRDEQDYWRTISHFTFEEQQHPVINVQMQLTSSWMNELVQVFQDVPLGTFNLRIPIEESDVRDSLYTYTRADALLQHRQPIAVEGECFVVPRSYMPVSATDPSWGTGQYKMKVILSQTCQYNPQGPRAQNWLRDYKQLRRMQAGGKYTNEYLTHVFTTIRENQTTILKAVYTPAVTAITTSLQAGKGAAASGAAGAAALGGGGQKPVQK